MRVEIKSDLFEDTSNIKSLNHLISMLSDNYRHDFFCEFQEIEETETFKQLIEIDQELIKQIFIKSITEGKRKFDHSITSIESESCFNLEEAKLYFSQPFEIILENNLNDAHFVDCLLREFPKKSKQILRQKKYDWIRYGNAGGCTNIPNYIEANKNRFKHLPKDNHKYLRCFVMIDSDKKFPDQKTPERDGLISYLIENEIPFHELSKKEIENYLPDNIIVSIPDNDEYISKYLSLTPIQKDFFDIEKGLPDENFEKLNPKIQKLFKSVSNDDLKFFRKEKMILKNFKSEFPKLFESATKENLKERTADQNDPDELEKLLSQIVKQL